MTGGVKGMTSYVDGSDIMAAAAFGIQLSEKDTSSGIPAVRFATSQICTDSRQIRPGDFFVPLRGDKVNGHLFIEKAIEKGAAFYVYSEDFSLDLSISAKVKCLKVKDTRKFYAGLASVYLQKIRPGKVIAVTGSVGKTTVRSMVAEILSSNLKVHWSRKSFNNEIGVPSTILACPPGVDAIVLEMGARHLGDIKYLCEIARPNLVCVLNAGEAHLAEFGSRENIVIGKTEIFRESSPDATLVVNADDPRIVRAARETGKTLVTFSEKTKNEADYWLEEFSIDPESAGSTISIGTPDDLISSNMILFHESLGVNVLTAVAISREAGLSHASIEHALSNLSAEKGRFQITHNAKKNLTIIDDSYNANPTSLRSGLDSLKRILDLKPENTTVGLILGDMLELGEESDEMHQESMEYANETICPSSFYYVGKNFSIEEYALNSDSNYSNFLTVEELVGPDKSALERLVKECDVIYLKASNAIGLDRVVAALRSMED
jgi:UDP-N-acetylmuramoyl-tripeptide--D-alanyl-D-alanine ligase